MHCRSRRTQNLNGPRKKPLAEPALAPETTMLVGNYLELAIN